MSCCDPGHQRQAVAVPHQSVHLPSSAGVQVGSQSAGVVQSPGSRAGPSSCYVTVSRGREEGVVEESVEGGVRMSTGSSGSLLTSGWPVRWCTLRGWCLLRL